MPNNTTEVYYQEDENGEWYTAIIDEMVYQMNAEVNHPQGGFNQFIGQIGQNGLKRENLGDKISFKDCPEEVQNAIQNRMSED